MRRSRLRRLVNAETSRQPDDRLRQVCLVADAPGEAPVLLGLLDSGLRLLNNLWRRVAVGSADLVVPGLHRLGVGHLGLHERAEALEDHLVGSLHTLAGNLCVLVGLLEVLDEPHGRRRERAGIRSAVALALEEDATLVGSQSVLVRILASPLTQTSRAALRDGVRSSCIAHAVETNHLEAVVDLAQDSPTLQRRHLVDSVFDRHVVPLHVCEARSGQEVSSVLNQQVRFDSFPVGRRLL